MKRIACGLIFFVVVFLSAVFSAGAAPVYPGAKVEDVYEIKQPEVSGKTTKGPKLIVYTTNDFFENVVAYYRGVAREYRAPGRSGNYTKLPSGQELKEAYFILDNASDITASKHWIKIQRPFFGIGQRGADLGVKGGVTVREVTGIVEEDKRTYP
jgi:hypothetical protein